MKQTLIGVIIGAAAGLLTAALNTAILRRGLKREGMSGITVATVLRMLLDAAVLGAIYLLRHRLPVPFAPTIIAAAVTMSLGIIAMAAVLRCHVPESGQKDTGGE